MVKLFINQASSKLYAANEKSGTLPKLNNKWIINKL